MSELETKILDLLENSDYPISTKDISMILKCKESSVSNALKKLLNEKQNIYRKAIQLAARPLLIIGTLKR